MEKSISRDVLNDVENACEPCGQFHENHVESSMRRHDIQYVDSAMYSVWREAYGDMISNMWRNASEPYGEKHK